MISRRCNLVLLLVLIAPLAGCQLHRDSARRDRRVVPDSTPSATMAAAECAFKQAIELEKKCEALCVDYFYQAATQAWPDLEQQFVNGGIPSGRAAEIYHTALCKLIQNGQRHCRFNPASGLQLETSTGPVTIPITYQGFPWRPDEFDQLLTVNETFSKELKTWYRCEGLGVATVAIHNRRKCEKFRRQQQAFAATVILRPVIREHCPTGQFEFVFADPLRISALNMGATSVAIERDPTAPIAYRISQKDRANLKEFIHPGATTENSGLFLMEPYQPGKIPLLFVHGLLSDPFTWANAANELRAHPELMARYQIWGFEYATGEPFLASAAVLRRQLREVRSQVDPTGSDPALDQMVLVGHSMGGLVSKLLVTHSGTELWDSVSCRPMEELSMDRETYARLADSFYFEPSPSVTRVVFMGTPHRGSPWARRPIGRFGAKLVEEPSSTEDMHRRLIRDNPNVFSKEFTKRIPTSIDLLRTDSPLLESMDRLPVAERVRLHTILGSGYWMLGGGNSDRVVPVSSARHPSAISEKSVHTKHTDVNEAPEAIEELFCILKQHWMENGSADGQVQLNHPTSAVGLDPFTDVDHFLGQ